MENKRYYSIDAMRAICAFLIVLLHCQIQGELGEYTRVIARIAVPFFFMVSGFFIYTNDEEKQVKRIWKQIKHLFILMITVDLFYFAYIFIIKNGDINEMNSRFNNLRFYLFNFEATVGHMWFIRALIYVLILFYIIKRIKFEKYVFFSIPVICIIDLCMWKYSLVLFGTQLDLLKYEYLTKFIGTAYVYFMIGYFIRVNLYRGILDKKKTKIYFLISIISFILNLGEYYVLKHYKVDVSTCNYFFTIILSLSLFLFLVNVPELFKDTSIYKIGNKYSLYIYILHPFIISLFGRLDVFTFVKIIMPPIVVYIGSLIVGSIISNIKSRFNN